MSWTLPSEVHGAWPVGNNRWIARDAEGTLVSPKALWPKDAWSPVPTVPAPMFKRGDRDDPEPKVSDDAEDEAQVDGDLGPVELLEEFQAVEEGQEIQKEDQSLEVATIAPDVGMLASLADDHQVGVPPPTTHHEYIVVDDVDDVAIDVSGPMPGVEDKTDSTCVSTAGLKRARKDDDQPEPKR